MDAERIREPQFDAMEPAQEALAIKFCEEIAGPRGQPCAPPDPVRLLEMAQALYEAEMKPSLIIDAVAIRTR